MTYGDFSDVRDTQCDHAPEDKRVLGFLSTADSVDGGKENPRTLAAIMCRACKAESRELNYRFWFADRQVRDKAEAIAVFAEQGIQYFDPNDAHR